MPHDFRVGDLVTCVDNDGFRSKLTIGKTYRVLCVDCEFIGITSGTSDVEWLAYRFQLSLGEELLRDDEDTRVQAQ